MAVLCLSLRWATFFSPLFFDFLFLLPFFNDGLSILSLVVWQANLWCLLHLGGLCRKRK